MGTSRLCIQINDGLDAEATLKRVAAAVAAAAEQEDVNGGGIHRLTNSIGPRCTSSFVSFSSGKSLVDTKIRHSEDFKAPQKTEKNPGGKSLG